MVVVGHSHSGIDHLPTARRWSMDMAAVLLFAQRVGG